MPGPIKRLIEESDADLFVIFGTAHHPMSSLFSVTRKDFETPLGTVETDRQFAAALTANLAATPGGRELNLAADELAHRQRTFDRVSNLVPAVPAGRQAAVQNPAGAGRLVSRVCRRRQLRPPIRPQVQAFVPALRKTAAGHAGQGLLHLAAATWPTSASDLAIANCSTPDACKGRPPTIAQLLEAACRADCRRIFRARGRAAGRNRICGLSPTYTHARSGASRERGELLKYDQAVELDGTSCVSFASLAFYQD